MKFNYLVLFIIILLMNCKPKVGNEVETGKLIKENNKQHQEIVNKEIAIDKIIKILSEKLSLNYNAITKKYVTDTISDSEFKYKLYGQLYSTTLDKHYFLLPIDSIEILQPFKAIVKGDLSGYLYKKNRYNYKDIIQFNDINNDNLKDLILFNQVVSGATGPSTFSIYLNKINSFNFFEHTTNRNVFTKSK